MTRLQRYSSLVSWGLLGIMGCNSGTYREEGRQPVHSEEHQAQPEKRAPSPDKESGLSPIEAPQAYFGAIKTKRLTAPLPFEIQKKGSVVLVIIDALNPKHLSLYGYERSTSPNIDRLAASGLMLTNYVSNSSWTRPSFTTIITGLPKQKHGVELSGKNLDNSIKTLAERFRDAGYKTAGFTGNPLVRDIWGFGQGFQVYQDTTAFSKAFPPDKEIADRAMAWLKKTKDNPSFLMVFFTAPHVPYRPPGRYRHFLKQLPKGPVIEYPFQEYMKPLDKDTHARIVAAYDGEISYVDAEVGRIAAFLEKTDRLKNTTLVVIADHGEVFGHHNCYVHAWHMWEPALRVPFIMVSPGLKTPGVFDDHPYTHVDLAPTLLKAVGIEAPTAELEGMSILAGLAHPEEGRTRIRLSEYNAHGIRRQAIRDDRYKLIHHHQVPDSALGELHSLHPTIPSPDPRELPTLARDGERYEFYDMLKDANEEENLFESKQGDKEVTDLMKSLAPYINSTGGTTSTNLSKEMVEALKNAGYIR